MISNYEGKTIGNIIECCLHEWGINNVFTIIVDNASANGLIILYLSEEDDWLGK